MSQGPLCPNLTKKSPKGSVPNCQSKFVTPDAIITEKLKEGLKSSIFGLWSNLGLGGARAPLPGSASDTDAIC